MTKENNNQVDIKKIIKGECVGVRFWICDFRFKDYMNKPIRLVKPTFVEVVSNDGVNKPIYYSKAHFRALNKNGTLSAKIIPLYDNTGYRFYTGEPLKVFNTKEECVEAFKSMVKKANKELKKEQIKASQRIEDRIKENQLILEKLVIKGGE